MAIRLFEITTSLGGLFSNSAADPYPKTMLSCDWRCCYASEDARYSVPSCHRQNCHGNMQLASEGFRSPQLPKVQGLHMHLGTYWNYRVFCCYCVTIPAVVANLLVICISLAAIVTISPIVIVFYNQYFSIDIAVILSFIPSRNSLP